MKILSAAFKVATAIAFIAWFALFAYPLWPTAARAVVLTTVVVLLSAMYAYFLFFAKHLDALDTKSKGQLYFADWGDASIYFAPRGTRGMDSLLGV